MSVYSYGSAQCRHPEFSLSALGMQGRASLISAITNNNGARVLS